MQGALVCQGDVVPYVNATGGALNLGDIEPIGELVGLLIDCGISSTTGNPNTTLANGATGRMLIAGVIEAPKVASAGACVAGQPAYWDAGNNRFTPLVGLDLQYAGVFAENAADAATRCKVLLNVEAGSRPATQEVAVAIGDAAGVLTAAEMINGIVVHSAATGRTLTTPTGAAISAGFPRGAPIGTAFRLSVIVPGTGADDISTLTAGDGNVTFVGPVTVGPNIQATEGLNGYGSWIFRCTAADTWVGYRVG